MAVHRNCDWKKSFRNDGRQSEDEINVAVVSIREERPSIDLLRTVSKTLSEIERGEVELPKAGATMRRRKERR
jgi:hypothetical protein